MSRGHAVQNAPWISSSFASRWSRYVIVYSRASEPSAADIAGIGQVHLAAAHGGDPRAQHRHQAHRDGARDTAAGGAAPDAFDLVALHVDQKHVGAAAIGADARTRQSDCLQGADAKDEEAAKPTASRITRV